MSERITAVQVGAPDPELRNSLIIDESASDAQDGVEVDGEQFAACYFNNMTYENGDLVCSGDELLRCVQGKWWRIGSCDTDNP